MSPCVELLNTGSELLLGVVRDLHLPWLARELFPLGLRISRQTTVPDGSIVRETVLESFNRAEVLIATGGLGPTTDDITRELISELLGMRLILHHETLERIKDRCTRRGYLFQPRMERQAMVPEGATVLANLHGTAPGLYLPPIEGISWASPHIFLLPGPPRELQPMVKDFVIPILQSLFTKSDQNECRIYRIVGMGESVLESKIGLSLSERGDLEVGYCARPNEVDFRLIGPSSVLDEVEPLILDSVGEHLISQSDQSLEEVIVALLKQSGATLSTAESCTGGLIANRLTDVPGASEVILVGFIAYSNQAKSDLLHVDPGLIDSHGAVSEEVAKAMAEGALNKSGALYALATTGIAGPGGGTDMKPVGTICIALAQKDHKTEVWKEFIPSDRQTFKQLASQSALDHLRKRLLDCVISHD